MLKLRLGMSVADRFHLAEMLMGVIAALAAMPSVARLSMLQKTTYNILGVMKAIMGVEATPINEGRRFLQE